MDTISSLGLKVWLLYVSSPDGKSVSAVPFASEERLLAHKKELQERKPHLILTYDPRPDIIL
jgi:hypothetical protein